MHTQLEDTSGTNLTGMPRILEVSGRGFCSIQPASLVVVALCSLTFGRLCGDEDSVDGDESSFLDR